MSAGTTAFPTDLDSNDVKDNTDEMTSTDHNDHSVQIEALQAKVGKNGSAVTSSHDYKLSGVTGTDKTVSKTGTEILTNKTIISPTIIDGFVGARATLAATLTTTVRSAFTKLALDTETYDVGANFASGKFVAPVNGYYRISAYVYFNNVTDNAVFSAAIYKNNSMLQSFTSNSTSLAGTEISAGGSDEFYLAATDYIELFYYHTDVVQVDIDGSASSSHLTVVLDRQVT